MRVHFVIRSSEEGPDFDLEKRSRDTSVLCGDTVKDAKAVLRLDVESGQLSVKSTLLTCRVCMLLALAPVAGRRYVYGVLPKEDAERLEETDQQDE